MFQTILYCFIEVRVWANGTILQRDGFQFCTRKRGAAQVNHGPTCAVGREGVSCAGNTLAETGQLKRGLFHRKLAFLIEKVPLLMFLIFFLWGRSNGFKFTNWKRSPQSCFLRQPSYSCSLFISTWCPPVTMKKVWCSPSPSPSQICKIGSDSGVTVWAGEHSKGFDKYVHLTSGDAGEINSFKKSQENNSVGSYKEEIKLFCSKPFPTRNSQGWGQLRRRRHVFKGVFCWEHRLKHLFLLLWWVTVNAETVFVWEKTEKVPNGIWRKVFFVPDDLVIIVITWGFSRKVSDV